jgi:hypothetical protein
VFRAALEQARNDKQRGPRQAVSEEACVRRRSLEASPCASALYAGSSSTYLDSMLR